MSMRRRVLARRDQWVSALDGELRTSESEHVLCRHSLAQKGAGSESFPHSDDFASSDVLDVGAVSCLLLMRMARRATVPCLKLVSWGIHVRSSMASNGLFAFRCLISSVNLICSA